MLLSHLHNIGAPAGILSPYVRIFVLCFLLFGALPQAVAQAPAAGADDSFSYVSYLPRPEEFPERLRPLVERMLKADAAAEGQQPAAWRQLLAEVKTAQSTMSRGYQDEVLHLLGFVYERLSERDSALNAYQSSLRLSARNPVALFRSAQLLKMSSRCKEAIPLLKEALWSGEKKHDEVLFALGECRLALGDEEKGLELIEQAIQSNPSNLPALRFVVEERQQSLADEIDPAKRAELEAEIAADLGRIRQLAPDDKEAAFSLARLLLRESDPLLNAERLTEAETIAKQFAEGSQFADSQAVRLLFDVHVKRGNLEAASAALNAGLEKSPNDQALIEAKRQLAIQQQVLEQEKEAELEASEASS